MKQTQDASSEVLKHYIEKQTGMTSQDQWKYCERTNGTYLDCPIADYNLTDGQEIYLSVQNPSNLEQKVGQISVPNGHFEVQAWSNDKKDFEEILFDIICYDDKDFDK